MAIQLKNIGILYKYHENTFDKKIDTLISSGRKTEGIFKCDCHCPCGNESLNNELWKRQRTFIGENQKWQ